MKSENDLILLNFDLSNLALRFHLLPSPDDSNGRARNRQIEGSLSHNKANGDEEVCGEQEWKYEEDESPGQHQPES